MSAPPPPPHRPRAWPFGVLPILAVGAAAAGYLVWGPSHSPTSAPDAPPSAPASLVPGRDYYVFVKTIELYPRQPGDKTWDRLDGSAPDIAYGLTWQDHRVYTSPTRSDTLIGLWDPIAVDISEALPLLGQGKLELAATLNQGAVINATPDATLTIDVWDEDPTGLGHDDAGQIVLRLGELRPGDNVLTFAPGDTNAVKRMVVGVTDTAQPAQNLLEALSAP